MGRIEPESALAEAFERAAVLWRVEPDDDPQEPIPSEQPNVDLPEEPEAEPDPGVAAPEPRRSSRVTSKPSRIIPSFSGKSYDATAAVQQEWCHA